MMPYARSAALVITLAALGSGLAGCGDETAATPVDAGTGTGATGGGGTGGTGGTGGGDAGMPCPGVGVSKGPWSLAANGTSAKVRWEACRDGTDPGLMFMPEDGGEPGIVKATVTPITLTETHTAGFLPDLPPDAAGTYYSHEAALTGLSPATCYHYALVADPARKGRFCTARSSGDVFKFMSVGDTNPGLAHYTSNLITHLVPENPDFILHGGDVQYYASGLETWASWFPLVEPLLAQGGFYPAVGNHESEQSDEFTGYFERFFGGAGFDGVTDYYRFESGGIWFFALNTEIDEETGPQAAWFSAMLEDAASQPGYRFSVVYFHKPWITCGDKSQDGSARAFFEPLFIQFGVPLVIQAHMHGYERFDMGPITYITSGGGGGALEDVNINIDRPECAFRVASGSFRHAMLFDVSAGALHGRAIDDQGVERDAFTLTVP